MSRTPISSPVQFDSYLYDGNSQFADVPDSPLYSIPTTGLLTVSIWAKQYTNQFTKNEGSGYVNFFGKTNFNTQNNCEWQMRIYSLQNNETDHRGNETSFYIFSQTGGLGISSDVRRQIHDVGRWVHYFGTVDNSKTEVRLYKDNICEEIASYSGVTPVDTISKLYWAHADNNGYFYGELGPAKIWNRILSDQERRNQFLSNESNTDGLVGHWVADQANNRLSDLSGNANHGTLRNSPTFISNAYKAPRREAPIRRPRYAGKALSLSGSGQYASIANASQSGLDLGTGDFLVTGMVQFNTYQNHQILIAKCDTAHTEPSASGATGFELIYTNAGGENDLKLFLRTSGGSSNFGIAMSRDLQPHAVAFLCKRGSPGRTQLWIDGVYVTNASPISGDLTNNGDLYFGASSGNARINLVNGKMWNWRLHKWAAGAMPNTFQQVIDDVFRYGDSNYSDGLVAKWGFQGNANDSVGSNNLTATGSPTYPTLSGRTVAS